MEKRDSHRLERRSVVVIDIVPIPKTQGGETMAKVDMQRCLSGPKDGSEVCEQIQLLAACTKQALDAIHDITCFAHYTVANTLDEAHALRATRSETTADGLTADEEARSEERRVGKECRSRWSPS